MKEKKRVKEETFALSRRACSRTTNNTSSDGSERHSTSPDAQGQARGDYAPL